MKSPSTIMPPLRVLMIVDSLHWVIGNFARQITRNHPDIRATICSQFAIRKTIRRFGAFPSCFDVVHFLRTKPLQEFWGSFPIVTTFHHLEATTNFTPFHQSDGAMTVSRQWHQYLTQLGIPENHQTLVPFGVDTNTFYPPPEKTRLKIRQDLHFPQDAFVLGFSSRRLSNINDRKGVTCFLQALQKLHLHLPNLTALIIGPGWQALAKEIRQTGIPCIKAPYQIDHEQVAYFYKAMDLFWVTSRVEGGPVPLLEAMASSIPCISTPVGAALDLIDHKHNGFIVSFDSPDQFVNYSLQLAKDEEMRHRIGKEARNTIVEKRQWNQAGEKLQNLYALAIKNFHVHSKQTDSEYRTKENNGNMTQRGSWKNPMAVELFSSKRVQDWIHTCELINGLRMMVTMKEWKAASRLGFQALRTSPFDLLLWKEMMSVLLKSRRSTSSQKMCEETPSLQPPKSPG